MSTQVVKISPFETDFVPCFQNLYMNIMTYYYYFYNTFICDIDLNGQMNK